MLCNKPHSPSNSVSKQEIINAMHKNCYGTSLQKTKNIFFFFQNVIIARPKKITETKIQGYGKHNYGKVEHYILYTELKPQKLIAK